MKTLKINQVKSLKLLIAQVSKRPYKKKILTFGYERSDLITQKEPQSNKAEQSSL